MMKFPYWIVQHKPTGHVLPWAEGKNGSGGSHVEPVNPATARPRLFESERAAKGYLTSWLKGRVVVTRHEYYDGPPEDSLNVVPVPTRVREDMEIVRAELVLD